MRIARSLAAPFTLILPTLFASTPALAASPAEQCIDANSAAQDARGAGQFEKASALLHACMADGCPKRIRDDCTERWEELQKVQPMVILAAKDDRGQDLADVVVTIDGRPLASKLDGVALRSDPGTHEFVFTAAGRPPVSVRAVIREAERQRTIEALIPQGVSVVSVAPEGAHADAAPPAAHAAPRGIPWRTVGIVGGGVGVASVAVGAIFGGLALSSKSKENSSCGSAIGAPSADACNADGVSAASSLKTQATLSSAFIIGGAVVAAGGTILYFLSPNETRVDVGLGTISFSGAF